MRFGYKDAGAVTPRMRDVAACGARGLTAKQTAIELGVSEATVVSVRKALCARLGTPNFTAACVTVALRAQEAA